ncbi:DNA-directed DNA polymerase [Tanacetum coccineum]
MNALSFYRMETDEFSERFIAPCFVNGLEAYDGEINLAFDENLISNEFAVKLCLDYEMKKGKKLVKKELIAALKGELYFVKFIINPEEDDFEPGVILERSFLRLAHGVVDFGNGMITIYPEPDLFEDDYEKTGKNSDDWDQLLDFNFNDVSKFREELHPFVCKIGKSNHNKKIAMENLNLFYQDIGPSSSVGDKVELDGKTVKEDEEAVKRIKGEALKEKDDPSAFIFPIRSEGKVNKNALADTGSDINTMPYRIYETLGGEDMKKIDRGITMINHTQAEAMGKLSNVLCQVGILQWKFGKLKGELYFVKFTINPEEDDFKPGVILGRSFLRLAQGVVDFGNMVITIYPEPDPFEDDSEKTVKSLDDWDQLLDFNFDDVPKFGEELPLFVCKMGKSNQEAAKEALAIRISQRYALLVEERPVIETMAYHDKYKKILDEIWKDKVELDGKTVKEDEEAVKRIKGEALKEKDDPSAFIFPIRLEGKVNENALADTGSDINTMPYRIYETLGGEDMKKIDRGITMINHTQAEAMGKLSNVLCQMGVTTMIAKFLILDIPIDLCHQTFRAARFDVLRTAESDSDDKEEYMIKRNKFGAPIYGSKPASYLNCTNPEDQSSAIQTVPSTATAAR